MQQQQQPVLRAKQHELQPQQSKLQQQQQQEPLPQKQPWQQQELVQYKHSPGVDSAGATAGHLLGADSSSGSSRVAVWSLLGGQSSQVWCATGIDLHMHSCQHTGMLTKHQLLLATSFLQQSQSRIKGQSD
jgi:hypothetical protein